MPSPTAHPDLLLVEESVDLACIDELVGRRVSEVVAPQVDQLEHVEAGVVSRLLQHKARRCEVGLPMLPWRADRSRRGLPMHRLQLHPSAGAPRSQALVRAGIAGLLFASACGGPVIPSTDSGKEDSDSIVDIPDTFVIDDSKTPGVDTDETGLTADTGACRFGEVADCTGVCFPAYFIGDGHCDDTEDDLPSNFNCATFRYDDGDCTEPDSADTSTPTGPCSYLVKMHTERNAVDISWTLSDAAGQPVAGVNAGQYTVDYRTYTHRVTLRDGVHEMLGKDQFGDGWHSGYWALVDERTGHEVFRGDASSLVSEFTWQVPVTCRRDPSCPVELTTRPGTDGGAGMSWELTTTRGESLLSALLTGTLSGTTDTRSVNLFAGTQTLAVRDLERDGWKGGVVEVRHPNGHLIGASAVPTAIASRENRFEFPVDCRLADDPKLDDPGETLTPSGCEALTIEMVTAADGREVGWSLMRVDDWSPVDNTHLPGTYEDDDDGYIFATLKSGLYYFQLFDKDAPKAGNKPATTGGDGWQGAELHIRDGLRGPILRTLTLPDGGAGGRYVRFECPPVDTDTSVDTDTDVDTDLDTDPSTCLPETVVDCDGLCWPEGYLGDEICDDGSDDGPNFDCARLSFDNGDCSSP